MALAAFAAVLLTGGWSWGNVPGRMLLASAAGSAFAVIATSQMANAFACRSESTPVISMHPLGNRALLWRSASKRCCSRCAWGSPL